MKLTTSELVYINEAAKALKQREFILIDNAMIGMDNIQNIITYILLDTNFIHNYNNGVIINQRSLSAFIKTLSVESEFEFDYINNTIKTISGGELQLTYDYSKACIACDKFKNVVMHLNNIHPIIHETETPDISNQIQTMKSADGGIGINYNGYYMILFPSFLPINKSDKLYVTIFQPYELHTFITKFSIKKKKFNVITYINYLKI